MSLGRLPRLLAITDWSLPNLEGQVEDLVRLGDRVAIRHRDPGAPLRLFLERGRWLAQLCQKTGTPLFINGRLEVALLVGAHLHLPEEAPSAREVRPHLPSDRWVSAAVHRDLSRAEGADLALVSPVFSPGSKAYDPNRELLGARGFFAVAERLTCPAYALGGIAASSMEHLKNAAGIAVVSSVFSAPSPSQAALELIRGLNDDGPGQPKGN